MKKERPWQITYQRAPEWSEEECARRRRQVYAWLLDLAPWPTNDPPETSEGESTIVDHNTAR